MACRASRCPSRLSFCHTAINIFCDILSTCIFFVDLYEFLMSQYRIQPGYHTVHLSISKILKKIVVKYVPTYIMRFIWKNSKWLIKWCLPSMWCLFYFFYFFVFFFFLVKNIRCRYPFELHLYKEVDNYGIAWLCAHRGMCGN